VKSEYNDRKDSLAIELEQFLKPILGRDEGFWYFAKYLDHNRSV